MVALEKQSDQVERLESLADALSSLTLGSAWDDLASERDQLANMLRSYLIPRASHPEVPLTVVFAGPTGSGKSTLVNSLAGRTLAETGPVRPTTKGPLALVGGNLGIDLLRIGDLAVPTTAGSAPILDSVVLIDTPDIDSTDSRHRVIAESLVDNADVVVFVTSALRYADEAPWQILRRALSRGAEVINVLNRVSSTTAGAMVDFKAKLQRAGLENDLVAISEHHIETHRQRVPSLAVRTLSRRLVEIGVRRGDTGTEVWQRVTQHVLDRCSALADRLDDNAHSLASAEAELDLALASRVPRLAWPSAMGVVFPASGRRRSIRRWRRTADRAVRDSDIEILVATIHSDLLTWVNDGETMSLATADVSEVVDQCLELTRSALSDWRDGLVSIVESNESGQWAKVAREDLVARTEVIYRHFQDRLQERLAIEFAPGNSERLRAGIAAVAATPIYA